MNHLVITAYYVALRCPTKNFDPMSTLAQYLLRCYSETYSLQYLADNLKKENGFIV